MPSLVERPLAPLASGLSAVAPRLVPTRQGRIVFAAFHGDAMRDTPGPLYEALCADAASDPRLLPIWLTRNPTLVATLTARFGPERVAHCHSLRGVRALAEASAVILSHGTDDLPWLHLPRRALTVQGYHGLPTKCGEYLRPDGRAPGPLTRAVLRYRFAPLDRFVSSSPVVSAIYAKRYRLPPEAFWETGYPAHDGLMASPPSAAKGSELLAQLFPAAPPSDHLILYAPTFRRRDPPAFVPPALRPALSALPTRLFPFDDFDGPALAAFLEAHRALIVLRPHPNEGLDLRPWLAVSPRIVAAPIGRDTEPHMLTRACSVIVTDYSGIFLEGLLLDRPCVFVPYDRDTWKRGIPWPYEACTPGDHALTQAALLPALDRALKGHDGHESERARVRELFFSHPAGGATERLKHKLLRALGLATR